MSRRVGPIIKSVKDVLADLLAGHAEAAHAGPEAALKYLDRVLAGQVNLPLAVRTVAHDRRAEALAQLQRWEDCIESVDLAIAHLPQMESAFPHAHRAMLLELSCFDRGISAHSALGRFQDALALCDTALALGLGRHFEAKRDSLDWAR